MRNLVFFAVATSLAISAWGHPVPKLSLDFDRTEVSVVLAEVARQLGKKLELDPWVRGKVTIHTQNSDTQTALTSVLRQLHLPSAVSIGDSVTVWLVNGSSSPVGCPDSCWVQVERPLTFSVIPGQDL